MYNIQHEDAFIIVSGLLLPTESRKEGTVFAEGRFLPCRLLARSGRIWRGGVGSEVSLLTGGDHSPIHTGVQEGLQSQQGVFLVFVPFTHGFCPHPTSHQERRRRQEAYFPRAASSPVPIYPVRERGYTAMGK